MYQFYLQNQPSTPELLQSTQVMFAVSQFAAANTAAPEPACTSIAPAVNSSY